MTDSLYALKPELAKAIDRQRLEASSICNLLMKRPFLTDMRNFGFSWTLWKIISYRQQRERRDESKRVSTTFEICSELWQDKEDYGFEDDYFVNCLSEVTIPAKDVVNLTTDRMNMM